MLLYYIPESSPSLMILPCRSPIISITLPRLGGQGLTNEIGTPRPQPVPQITSL